MANRGKNSGRPLTGEALKAFRHNQAVLYKKGLAKKGANQQQVTRYAKAKQRKLKDVIEGRAVAVRANKAVRSKYIEKGIFSSFGSRLIVPKERAKERVRISKGLVTIASSLKNGQEERIVFPVALADMQDLVNRLRADPTLGGAINDEDTLGFRLYGHNMRDIGYTSTEELAEAVEVKYQHLFKPGRSHDAVQYFQLVRFKGTGIAELPESERHYSPNAFGKVNSKGRSEGTYGQQKRAARAATQQRYIESLKARGEYDRYKAKQAKRSAQYRQRKFEDR
jgi:hypothetical protein